MQSLLLYQLLGLFHRDEQRASSTFLITNPSYRN